MFISTNEKYYINHVYMKLYENYMLKVVIFMESVQ